nr:MAG TPA: hypothetical protein [Caudoviricetes sp.]
MDYPPPLFINSSSPSKFPFLSVKYRCPALFSLDYNPL